MQVNESEEVAMMCMKLASKFLFSVGFHTKKTLRGHAQDWYDALEVHLRSSTATRGWFAQHILFDNPHRFMEYLLECPAPEVRLVFSKIIVRLAHCSRSDPPLALSFAALTGLYLFYFILVLFCYCTVCYIYLISYFNFFLMIWKSF